MHKTHNDLSQKVRESVCSGLNALLADTADLGLQAKQAHWAVRGPGFIALHKLFDDVYEHAGEWADDIAERVAALGGQPQGTLQLAAKHTRLDPYPADLVSDREHVARLAQSLGKLGSYVRAAIDEFTRLGDAGSADLMTEISRAVDKDLWFVEAHQV
jgi:starvation-inducible DNA-binding protein